ncbi:MAG: phenylalanine--tRNA ligase subunit beta, partial [Thermodesulfobacteriota bacterium]
INLKDSGLKASDRIKVSVEDSGLCSRYALRVIEGVKIAQSPEWLRKRLEASGVRPVNNVVDVTNYVMLETGQPLHAFDVAKIAGARLIIRRAKENEEITTIDNKKRDLKAEMLVISDERTPQAIAGVMGGKASEVTDSTTGIVLEGAHFLPSMVRKTSRLLGLSSDSSYRFERGVDVESIGKTLDRAAALITEISGGTCLSGMTDEYSNKFRPISIRFDVKRANGLLGYEIAKQDVAAILMRLGMEVKPANDAFGVTPPSFRQDIKSEADLVEETARINGYDKIPVTLPKAAIGAAKPSSFFLLKKRAGEALRDFGFNEVINYSFVSKDIFSVASNGGKDGFCLSNPLSEEQGVLRQSLVPSLLENLKLNLSNKNEEVNIFERRVVFESDGKKPKEVFKLAGLMYGLREGLAWNRPKDWVDFYDAKGIIEALFACVGLNEASYAPEKETKFLHPGKSTRVFAGDKPVAIVGELHPDIAEKYGFKKPVYVFEIELGGLLPFFEAFKKYVKLPKFPESTRDIAFIVGNDISYSEIIGYVASLDVKLIENVSVFDVYCGQGITDGKKSMALRIVYRSMERTLTYEEVEAAHDVVRKGLFSRFGAEVRQG